MKATVRPRVYLNILHRSQPADTSPSLPTCGSPKVAIRITYIAFQMQCLTRTGMFTTSSFCSAQSIIQQVKLPITQMYNFPWSCKRLTSHEFRFFLCGLLSYHLKEMSVTGHSLLPLCYFRLQPKETHNLVENSCKQSSLSMKALAENNCNSYARLLVSLRGNVFKEQEEN